MLMTTTEAIPGYLIERVLGLVEASSGILGLGSAAKSPGRLSG
jgi:uncharacterized protein YbjQ (UPF0145 family)